jgi:hypothetical protein
MCENERIAGENRLGAEPGDQQGFDRKTKKKIAFQAEEQL